MSTHPTTSGCADTRTTPSVCRAEQAIFTSIRTPMGEGYRLVAMSPGVTAEERAEIARRSPSHSSICSSDPTAAALMSYTLCTQRHCVGWTRYAGKEHTARGGQRVHTHLVVLEPEDFQAFACDPFRVQAAMVASLGLEPDVKPSPCLEPLELTDAVSWPGAIEPQILGHVCALTRAMISDRTVLTLGSHSPFEVARWAMAVLPQACRTLSFSANLQYALSRHLQLTCVGQDGPELRRAVQGQDVLVCNLDSPQADEGGILDPWLKLLSERCAKGRLPEFCTLAAELHAPLDLSRLVCVADACRDADHIAQASKSVLEEMVTRYGQMKPAHPVEGRLVRQLLTTAVRHAADLQSKNGPDRSVEPARCGCGAM